MTAAPGARDHASAELLRSRGASPDGPCVGDFIELKGLRVLGTHGQRPEERRQPQPFEVDVSIWSDLAPAAGTDSLEDTVDYSEVAAVVATVVSGPHVDLLERLADAIAQAVLQVAAGRASAVAVTVRKLRPPLPLDLQWVSATVVRSPG